MGSCLEVLSKAWKGGNINTWVWVVKNWCWRSLLSTFGEDFSHRLPSTLHSRCFDTSDDLASFTLRACLTGTPCGAKQADINLPFVWIFRYSCLRHADSSWWARAPQIPWCHAWTEAAASGPRQAHNLPRSHQWHPQHMVVSSINTFSSPRQIGGDTFSMLLRRWWNSRMWQMKEFDHFIITSVATFESWFAIDTQQISRDVGQ